MESLNYHECSVPSAYRKDLNRFKRHVKGLKELGINPILLPKGFDLKTLSNPYNDLMSV